MLKNINLLKCKNHKYIGPSSFVVIFQSEVIKTLKINDQTPESNNSITTLYGVIIYTSSYSVYTFDISYFSKRVVLPHTISIFVFI